MDRIINVKISGNHLTKDGKNAGTRGEAYSTILRITFDEGWDGYAKSVVFLDAHGMNPTRFTLTTNLLENAAESTRIYLVPIPPEPLDVAGEMSFSVEGYIEGKRQRSVYDTLEVHDGIITDAVNDPTPTQAEQLQAQYESIIKDIQQTAIYRNEAEAFAENAENFAENAENSAKSAEQTKVEVENLKNETLEEVDTQKQEALGQINSYKQIALSEINTNEQTALGKIDTYKQIALGEIDTDKQTALGKINANKILALDELDANKQNALEEMGTFKKGSLEAVGVLVEDARKDANRAEDYANRAENAIGKTNYIGENGNWYAWDSKKNAFYDTGVKAQSGSTVYVGDNPPADADVWIDENGDGLEFVQTPDDEKLESKSSIPSMLTMSHYIGKAINTSNNVIRVLSKDTVFEDLDWGGDKGTKIFILEEGLYNISPTCKIRVTETSICFITRNALEYYETYYFLTFISELGIRFFDFIDSESNELYYTDSPNREFSFADVDSILTFGKIEDSSTTFPCIHLMSPSGNAYMITVSDDGMLEATPHD